MMYGLADHPIRKAKISIVGVGAVAQLYHLPAIRHIGARFSVVVDVNKSILEKVSATWSPNFVSTNLESIDAMNTDLCIISTPPDLHLLLAQQLLKRGLNVLIEKPLVISMKEYEKLCQAERQSCSTAFGGQVRRFFPNIMLLKRALDTGIFGELRQLKIAEGNLFRWKTVSGYIADENDEGVITDTGAHIFDIIVYLLGQEQIGSIKVRECAVDRYPNTNNLRFTFGTDSGIDVEVKISRTGRLANKIYAIMDYGILVTESGFSKEPLRILTSKYEPTLLHLGHSNSTYNVSYAFVLQFLDVLQTIEAGLPTNSSIHYSKLEKSILFFDIIRSSYRVLPESQWGAVYV